MSQQVNVELLNDLSSAIMAARDYLIRHCFSDGRFDYRRNSGSGNPHRTDYNVARHAGVIYALADCQRDFPSEGLLDTLTKAEIFLFKHCIAPVDGTNDLLAVWTNAEITGGKAPPTATVGATGLGLLALQSLQDLGVGAASHDTLNRLGEFLKWMQLSSGAFYGKYVPCEKGKCGRWMTLFYPGEAALALHRLYEKDRNDEWFKAARRALIFLAKTHLGEAIVPVDHWTLLATNEILPLCTDPTLEGARRLMGIHSLQICHSLLRETPIQSRGILRGALIDCGRCGPTAARLEGLLAALNYIDDFDPNGVEKLMPFVAEAAGFLLRAQIKEGELVGGFPFAVKQISKSRRQARFGFNERLNEVRIDYVQHALSALLHYRRLITR